MIISQEYNIPELVESFEKNWNMTFDPDDRESCCCLFEELVFGRQITPAHATAIVEAAKENRKFAKSLENKQKDRAS